MSRPDRWLLAGLSLLLALGGAASLADVLHLRGGGTVVVAEWWEERGTLFYETDAGTVGIPRSEVVRIETRADDSAPSYRGDPEALAPRPEGAREEATPGSPSPLTPTLSELEEAITRIELDWRRAGSDTLRDSLGRGLADLHVLRARARFRGGDEALAEDDYRRALSLVFDHRIARIELGWLLLRAGETRAAVEIVDTGLAGHPGDGHLLELRGEVFYRAGRLLDAEQAYASALAARPGTARLETRLAKIRRDLDAERHFSRADSQHFVLSYDGRRDDALGAELLDALENAYDELTRELDAFPREPIPVIVLTKRAFHETTGMGPEVAGLFDGKIRLPMGGVQRVGPAVTRVARHELVHALLFSEGRGRLPRWLHQGLAQLLEPRSAASVNAALRLALERGHAVGIDPFSYPTSLSFTTYLDERHGRSRLLWFVRQMAKGRSEHHAFLEVYRRERKELIEEWLESLRRDRR